MVLVCCRKEEMNARWNFSAEGESERGTTTTDWEPEGQNGLSEAQRYTTEWVRKLFLFLLGLRFFMLVAVNNAPHSSLHARKEKGEKARRNWIWAWSVVSRVMFLMLFLWHKHSTGSSNTLMFLFRPEASLILFVARKICQSFNLLSYHTVMSIFHIFC